MPTIKKIKYSQTVPDFTCQNAGSLEGLFTVAELNGISITGDIDPGTFLMVEEIDQKTISFYKGGELDIVTDARIKGGIGYMQIGFSFKVS
jgi:hypothetical protein